MATLGPLAAHFNCFAPDFMGSGYSEKPRRDYEIGDYVEQVSAFMTGVRMQRASLIRLSLCAWVAGRFASTYPEMVDKVILNAPFGLADDAEEISAIITRRGRLYDDPTWETIRKMFDTLFYRQDKCIDDLIALRQTTYKNPEAKDRPLFRDTAQRMVKLFLNAVLLPIDNVGHWPQFEDPEAFNKASINFLLHK